jgi:hypothetical protein
MMTVSMPIGNLTKDSIINSTQVSPTVLSQKLNIGADDLLVFNQTADQKAKDLKAKADAIDTFFKEHNMPLEGKGMKMVEEAEANNIDWKLVASISAIETTGGRSMCKNPKAPNNPFGWGSCKIGFKSIDEAIEVVSKHLGGNAESTAKHYAGKTTKEILQKYNPPSIVPKYADKVMKIMDEIGQNVDTIDTKVLAKA